MRDAESPTERATLATFAQPRLTQPAAYVQSLFGNDPWYVGVRAAGYRAQDDSDGRIRAAFVIGSRARVDHSADEWSDLDVIILAQDPAPYVSETGWLSNIWDPWLSFVEATPDGKEFERRVLFEPGLDVDFVPGPVAGFRRMLAEGFPPEEADMLGRGVRVLLDKDGLLETLSGAGIECPEPALPDETEFLNTVNDFWYHTVWTAKKLRRGELWWAKSCCDTYLKQILLRMLEWHARASSDQDVDTWMRGRFLEEWADRRAVQQLPEVFARYGQEDVWRALSATMDLFRRLAVETADSLGYRYPADGAERAAELVEKLGCGIWPVTGDNQP
jgi:aminoglycoside 6-adenylyltransferase